MRSYHARLWWRTRGGRDGFRRTDAGNGNWSIEAFGLDRGLLISIAVGRRHATEIHDGSDAWHIATLSPKDMFDEKPYQFYRFFKSFMYLMNLIIKYIVSYTKDHLEK